MFHLTLTLLILFYSSSNVLTKTTNATSKSPSSSEKLFCASCSYEYTFDQLRNQSTWESPWSRCENQTSSTSKFGATACHTLLRIDYARQYVTIYYNASYLSLKKLPDDDRRIVIETTMSSNGSRAQLKAFYECSFEDNCHLPLKPFLQLQTALILTNYNYTHLIRRLNKFYGKPKEEVYTYFHADTLTSTLNGYCGDMGRFDKQSLKTLRPKCLKKEDRLKSKFIKYDDELKATVYTCNGSLNTYCSSEKKLRKFLHGITLTDYLQNFFGWRQ
jgi:hypothetical protein